MISEATERLILKLGAEGKSNYNIRALTGASRHTIAAVKTAGCVRPRRGRRMTHADEVRIFDLRKRVGLKVTTIAQMLDRSPHTIMAVLSHGAPKPPERVEQGEGRCPECGAWVYLPCMECTASRWRVEHKKE